MSHMKCLGRVLARVESAHLHIGRGLPDPDLVEAAGGNDYLARMLQAARDLDAESVRQADEDPVLRDLLGPY